MTRANPRTTHDNAGIAAWKFKLKAEIHSYMDAGGFLQEDYGGAPLCPGDSRELGPHMTIVKGHGYIAVVLYDTEIIRYYPDGTFSVDNGGFNTPTTMYRLNAVLPPGFTAWHHKKMIALNYLPDSRMNDGLRMLDHSKLISPTTIAVLP